MKNHVIVTMPARGSSAGTLEAIAAGIERHRLAHAAAMAAFPPLPRKLTPVQASHARRHIIDLEQCSLFVDSEPLKRAMTDAAAFLRGLLPKEENQS